MKHTIRVISGVLVLLMLISIVPTAVFADNDVNGNPIVDRRPEVYVPPRDPVDTIAAGAEPAMPKASVIDFPDTTKDFEPNLKDDISKDIMIDSVAIKDVVYPKVGKEPSYHASVTYLSGNDKIFADQDSFSLKWEEYVRDKETKEYYYVVPDVFHSGAFCRLKVVIDLPDGYALRKGSNVTLNGGEVRYEMNENQDKLVIYYYYNSIGSVSNIYEVIYDIETIEPTSDRRFPKARSIHYKLALNNYAPIPADPYQDGYIFAGWFENYERTVPYNFNILINHNRTIYAKWIKIIDYIEVNSSNIYPSANEIRPTFKYEEHPKYHIVSSAWIESIGKDNWTDRVGRGSAAEDKLYTGNLEAGQTYTLRIAIEPDIGWGVFTDDIDSIRARVNGVIVQVRFDEDANLLYAYFPITVLNKIHDHNLRHIKEVPAKCEKSGNKEYWQCRQCNQLFLSEDAEYTVPESSTILPALGHAWGEWEVTREASCKREGSEKRVCGNDKRHVETQAIPKTDHTWGEWEPYGDQYRRKCSVCGTSEVESAENIPGLVIEEPVEVDVPEEASVEEEVAEVTEVVESAEEPVPDIATEDVSADVTE